MESVHILVVYGLNQGKANDTFWSSVDTVCKLGKTTVCAAVAHIGAQPVNSAAQSLKRGARQEDTAGGDAIRVTDWIVSAPLLFCRQCPPRYLSLPVCLPLTSATNPNQSFTLHFQLSFIPSPMPILSFAVSRCPSHILSLLFPFRCWPFITQNHLKVYPGGSNGFLDS